MADNVQVTAGSGTTVATDEIGGVHYPRGKVGWGADGAYVDVSAAAPLPVSIGTAVAVTGPLTDTQLRATPVPVSGTVAVSALGGTVTVSGPLTDAQARAAPLPTTEAPATSGGLSSYRRLATADTNATSVKASAGQVYGLMIYNLAAATRHVKLYDKATAPTVGTDEPKLTIPLPAGGGVVLPIPMGLAFAAGIGLGIVTGVSDADATAPAANDIIVNILYK